MAKQVVLWKFLYYYAQSKGLVAEKINSRRYEVTNNETGITGVYRTTLEAYTAIYYGDI